MTEVLMSPGANSCMEHQGSHSLLCPSCLLIHFFSSNLHGNPSMLVLLISAKHVNSKKQEKERKSFTKLWKSSVCKMYNRVSLAVSFLVRKWRQLQVSYPGSQKKSMPRIRISLIPEPSTKCKTELSF